MDLQQIIHHLLFLSVYTVKSVTNPVILPKSVDTAMTMLIPRKKFLRLSLLCPWMKWQTLIVLQTLLKQLIWPIILVICLLMFLSLGKIKFILVMVLAYRFLIWVTLSYLHHFLQNVLVVPRLKLFSVSQLTKNDICVFEFSSLKFKMKYQKPGKTLATGSRLGDLYSVDFPKQLICLIFKKGFWKNLACSIRAPSV